MERMPKSGWKREKEGVRTLLFNVETDPITGVVTKWKKDLKFFFESRTDQLPNSPLSRSITRVAKPLAIPEDPKYSIDSIEDGINKKGVELERSTDGLSLDIKMSAMEKPHLFSAYYSGDNLTQISIYHSTSHLGENYESLKKRPLSQNIQELAEIYGENGEAMTFSPSVGIVHTELDRSQKGFLEWEKSDYEKNFKEATKTWSDEERTRVTQEVKTVVSDRINQELGETFQKEDLDMIASRLTADILISLPSGFEMIEDPEQSRKIIELEMNRSMALLIAANKETYEMLNDFYVEIKFDKNDPENIFLGVFSEDLSGYELVHSNQIRLGKPYRYESQEYLIYRDEQGNIVTSVVNCFKPTLGVEVVVPEVVDSEKLKWLMTTPNNSGWEKALGVADIRLRKIGSN